MNHGNKKFQNGLGYILSHEATSNNNRRNQSYPDIYYYNNSNNKYYHNSECYVGWSSGDDPIQLALWAYIKSYPAEAEEFFNESLDIRKDKIVINDSNKTIKEKPNYWKYDVYEKQYPITYKENGLAYTIFKNAQNERENINTKYDFEIILYKNGNSQKFIHVITAKKEEPAIANLTINKKDSLTGKNIKEAIFNLEISNIADIKGETVLDGEIIKLNNRSVNDNGQLVLQDLKAKDPNEDITITITEIKAPGGYKISNGTTTIILEKDGSNYKIKSGDASIANNAVTININNQPLINLSGNVWQDAQTGDKLVTGPNGKRDKYYKYNKVEDGKGNYIAEYKDGDVIFKEVGQGKGNYTRETISEKGIEGIIVKLVDANNTNSVKETTTTDKNGDYSFNNQPMTENGYKIIFEYDGINYKQTVAGQSQASEKNRGNFNDKFKSISKDIATATNEETTSIEYDYNSNNETSTLRTTIDGTNLKTGNADFRMVAITDERYGYKDCPNYEKHEVTGIDYGLVKKEFDLSIGTDVKSAKLKINDREIEYSYAQIMDGKMEDLTLDKILENNSSTAENIKYNLYLYTSDYNYRISDYKMGNEAISNKLNGEDNTVNNYDNLKALEAYVTYSVILKNQSTHKATVDEFVYYYDAAYTPYNINSTNEYDVSIDTNARKITFTSKNGGLSVNAPDYRKEIDLTFKVNGDKRGIVAIKENCTNIAEITKYSTNEGGLIDNDSAPGNGVTFENGTAKIGQYEDDTDQARGLKISLKDESRTITGTVFEDTKGEDDKYNGKKEDAENPVNDVIVQLIEIKTINGKNREYIWQETRSGSNTVKTTARNGYQGETYPNSVEPGSGMYEFKDYIPGNYIIRYIYGDGSVYDNYNLSDEEKSNCVKNAKTYNGQDYKSTIDEHYQAEWYNKANYKQYASVARDNEARRLKVMAYSTMIEKTNGNNLVEMNAEALEGTWMAAETSKLNVPIDSSTTPTEKSTVLYDTMNFGLALRPETKLVLEKHITGLKITPSGTGVQPIVDARANIEQVINEGKIDTTGVTTGLATIKSDRSERGFWKVETDIEELAQGAQLEVEYTYVIRNDSDEDYLRIDLVEQYSDNPTGYGNWLKGESDNIKGALKGNTHVYGNYLGQYYYTGNKGQNDIEVLSRVEELEEALNNQLKYDETVAGEDFVKVNTEGAVSKNIYDTDGNLGTRNIETIVKTTSTSEFLRTVIKDSNSTEKIKWHDKTVEGVNDPVVPNADYSKTLKLTTVLTSFNNGAGYYPSYIAEITKYSNAAGRRNMNAEPANLSYVHSEDTDMTLENTWQYEIDGTTYTVQGEENIPENATNIVKLNEVDEFWGEQIIISKPTGFNKQLAIQIVIITISSISVIGVGIVLIKKFVLKK